MTRVEIIGDARLILGDCRDHIGGESFDALIVDPVWPNCPPNADVAGKNDPWRLFEEIMAETPPETKRIVVVMRNDSDPRFLRAVPEQWPFLQALWLQYVMPGYLGRVLGGNEVGYCFGRHIPSSPGQRVIPSVAPKAQPGDRPANGHPMSRAPIHFDWIVHWWSQAGETICDPCMGSGTTGVSAVKRGRRFIGIEAVEKYFDIACRQIENAYRQRDLFVDQPKSTMRQSSFFEVAE